MSCRTVFLHCLMQSEMLFCMQRSGIRYLFSISFMFLTLNLLAYETETTLFLRKNKNFSGCPFTSSLVDRCKDVILQYWNQGIAAVEWMHIKLMLQKDKCAFTSQQSLCLVPWGTQHPPLLRVQPEMKKRVCSQVIPQHSMQPQTIYGSKCDIFHFHAVHDRKQMDSGRVWPSEVFHSYSFKRS